MIPISIKNRFIIVIHSVMQGFSQERFETLIGRYYQRLVCKSEILINNSRDRKKVYSDNISENLKNLQAYESHIYTDAYFRLLIYDFTTRYARGDEISSIFEFMEPYWEERRLNKAIRKESRTYYKLFKILRTPFVKEIIVRNYKGQVLEIHHFHLPPIRILGKIWIKSPLKIKQVLWNYNSLEAEGVVMRTEDIVLSSISKRKGEKDTYFKFFARHYAYERYRQHLKYQSDRNDAVCNENDSLDTEISTTEFGHLKRGRQRYTHNAQIILFRTILEVLLPDQRYINRAAETQLLHIISSTDVPLDKNGNEAMDNSFLYKLHKNFSYGDKRNLLKPLIFVKEAIENVSPSYPSELIKAMIKILERRIENCKI